MKKKFLILILFLNASFFVPNSFAQAPNWLWAKGIGGTSSASNDVGGSIATDAAGNTYTTGYFGGTVDFDPGPGVYNLTAVNPSDDYILKLDSAGNFLWANRLGIFNYNNTFSIAVDASGNVYTTSFFSGTVDFDPGVGVFNLSSAGASDVYVRKLDASGNFIWAKAMGGPGNETGYTLALDASANVYVAGTFVGTVDFDPGTGISNLTSTGYDDIYISKLDSAGSFIWAKALGGPGYANCNAITINPSTSADIYLTGSFNGTSDFDPDTGVFNLTSNGNINIFICKLDSAGNFAWAKGFGGTTGNDIAWSIAVDPTGSGDVYAKGRFDGIVDFDPGVGVFNLTGTGGFISKLDGSGNFIWAIALGGNVFLGRSLAIDASGDIYASGTFMGTPDFDPGPGTFYLTSAGSNDVFVSKFDSAGNFLWVKAAGGQDSDINYSLALDASGNIYLTGIFFSTSLAFGPFIISNANGTYGDLFVVKLESTFTTGTNEMSGFQNNVSVFPNPFTDELTISSHYQNATTIDLHVKNTLGQTIVSQKFSSGQDQQKIDLRFLSKGIYFLEMNAGEERMTTRILKQ